MEKKLLLNSKDILYKELSKGSYGYSIEEVNKFLDVIAKDYEKFEEVETDLMNQIKDCEANMKILETELRSATHAKITAETELSDLRKGGNTDYGTVLKRLNTIEQKKNNISEQEYNNIHKKLDQIIATLPHNTE